MATSYTKDYKLLFKGSAIGLVGQVINAVLSFAFAVLVGRLFHAKGTGVLFEAIAFFSILSNVVDLGADDGLSWSLPKARLSNDYQKVRSLMRIALLPVGVVGALVGAAAIVWSGPLSRLIAHGSGAPALGHFIVILGPCILFAAASEVLIAGIRSFDRVWPFAFIYCGAVPGLRLFLLVVLFAAGLGLSGATFAFGLPNIACAAVLLALLLSYAKGGTGAGTKQLLVPDLGERHLARIFWRFSAPRAFASICAMSLAWIDVLLVGSYLSAKQAGIYAIASRYLGLITFSIAAAGNSLAPMISKLRAEDRINDLKKLYQISSAWIMVISWPGCLLLAIYAPLFMGLFGHDFRHGAGALVILSLMMLYVTATGANTVMLVMSGSSSTSLIIGFATLAVNVVCNIFLIPRLGIEGAAWSWAGSLLVANVAINIVLFLRFKCHPFSAAWWRIASFAVLCIGAVGVLCRFIFGAGIFGLFGTLVLGGTLYLLCLAKTRAILQLGSGFFRLRRANRIQPNRGSADK